MQGKRAAPAWTLVSTASTVGALVPPMIELFALSLHHDQDVVTARQRAAQIAGHLGFDASEQTRVATAAAVSATKGS